MIAPSGEFSRLVLVCDSLRLRWRGIAAPADPEGPEGAPSVANATPDASGFDPLFDAPLENPLVEPPRAALFASPANRFA